MATDWAADVRKYAPGADEAVIGGIVRFCGIALNSRDSALVAFSDKDELARVRDSFLKKKLGLKQADDALDAAISEVGQRLKGVRNRNRVTVYYLLAESLGKLSAFEPKAKAAEKTKATPKAKPATKVVAEKPATKPAKAAKAPAKATTAAPAKAAALRASDKTKAPVKAKVELKPTAEPVAAPVAAPVALMEAHEPVPAIAVTPQPLATAASTQSTAANGINLWWVVLAITVAVLIWFLFLR